MVEARHGETGSLKTLRPNGEAWNICAGWVRPCLGPFEPLHVVKGSIYPRRYVRDAIDAANLALGYAPTKIDAVAIACREAKREIDQMTFCAHVQINAMVLAMKGAEDDWHVFTYKTYTRRDQ